MNAEHGNLGDLAAIWKRIAKLVLITGTNRVELLLVELQEERERLVLILLFALGVVVFGLLAGVALIIATAILFWEHCPLVALLVLTAVFLLAGVYCNVRLARLRKDWETLPITFDQLRKDGECLEQSLS
jgi:uncharacterized membrane protein YqjE